MYGLVLTSSAVLRESQTEKKERKKKDFLLFCGLFMLL